MNQTSAGILGFVATFKKKKNLKKLDQQQTQLLVLKYQSLVINSIIRAKISIASDKTQSLVLESTCHRF